ncbi:hypothetical protein J6590_018457, partial [Homalodisca vitripennis]
HRAAAVSVSVRPYFRYLLIQFPVSSLFPSSLLILVYLIVKSNLLSKDQVEI